MVVRSSSEEGMAGAPVQGGVVARQYQPIPVPAAAAKDWLYCSLRSFQANMVLDSIIVAAVALQYPPIQVPAAGSGCAAVGGADRGKNDE